MTYPEIVDWLFQQIPNYQKQGGSAYKPGLDGINNLLNKTNNSYRRLKTIHVAGQIHLLVRFATCIPTGHYKIL